MHHTFFFLIYLFLAALGLCCCAWAFSSCGARASHCSCLSRCGARAPGTPASVAAARGLQSAGPAVAAYGSSHSTASGILPHHGSNPRPPHWQADSQQLRHQGSPHRHFQTSLFILPLFHLPTPSLAFQQPMFKSGVNPSILFLNAHIVIYI